MLAALLLAILGAALKGLAALEGSRAALVDLLTCIANLAAAAAALHASRVASMPPDCDHPYGHRRYEAAGALWVTMIYAFVAGYAAATLLEAGEAAGIPPTAAYYAAAGVAAYAAAILAARRAGLAGRAYAAFTVTELYEGAVTVAAAALGSLLTPLVDLAAAWGLLAYLLHELYEETRRLTELLTDRVPPEVIEAVKNELERHGLRVRSVRLRPILPGEYIGDATVEVEASSLAEAHRAIDEVEARLRRRRVILTIHYEPLRREE